MFISGEPIATVRLQHAFGPGTQNVAAGTRLGSNRPPPVRARQLQHFRPLLAPGVRMIFHRFNPEEETGHCWMHGGHERNAGVTMG